MEINQAAPKFQDASIAPMHTTEHIVNRTMVNLFGCERAVSAHIERKKSKLDFALPTCPTKEEINRIEKIVNETYTKMLEQPREMGEMTLKDFVPMSLRCQMRSNRKSGKCKEKQNIAGERFANHYPRRCKI